MLSYVLRGITTAMLVTVLTLFGGVIWGAMGFGGLNVSGLLDIGLLASCLIGGYRTAKESGEWLTGGITGAGYVTVGTLLLALFLPIRVWGFIQVLGEGILIGLVAGAVGAGGKKGKVLNPGIGRRATQPSYRPYFAGYGSEDQTDDFAWDADSGLQNDINEPKEDSETNVDFEVERFELGSEQRDFDPNPEVEWPWNERYEKIDNMKIQDEPVKPDEPTKISESRPWWE
ncbi:hypothetical protein [Desulfosporosinus sp. SB140]|uniref:hypothetical protein n=1 Tax=Desulfosporosinus paludis TaxID=3115649 RepID=UPI00388FD5E4